MLMHERKQQKMVQVLEPLHPDGSYVNEVLGSRLRPSPALVTVIIWTVNQWMGNICNYSFQIFKAEIKPPAATGNILGCLLPGQVLHNWEKSSQ